MESVLLRVLLITNEIARFSALMERLPRQQKIELATATSAAAGFLLLKGKQIDLVVADERLDDMSGITFVKLLVKLNPLVNTAIVSTLTAEEFHEATEGLGVLMQLPAQPQEQDVEALLAVLEKIRALLQPVVS
jgi:DNA-binding NarL/FixJ family response regulator